ncbi:MAG: PD-(D/E)XK nuclease family protein [Candidatus Eisenbacteria bacterium]|nr:PD-(D/E)XK nuclease family protein [Candidatus Eisenbacteria bacterium]
MARLVNEFSWSFSRAKVFEDCKRKYWFNYYGSWGGWEDSAPLTTKKIYLLKNLKSRWMWSGEVVHRWVRDILSVSRTGRRLVPDEVVERAKEEMRSEYKESRKNVESVIAVFSGKPESGRSEYAQQGKKKGILLEHFYDPSLPDEKWVEIVDGVERCVRNFFSSPVFGELTQIPDRDWLQIEDDREFPSFSFEGDKVFAKPDCAHRAGDSAMRIIDWKTDRGKRVEGQDSKQEGPERPSVQLGCYALYAMNEWGGIPGKIQVLEQNLFTMERKESLVGEETLDETRRVIRESVRKMKDILSDRESNSAEEEDFPLTENRRLCNYCNFRILCGRNPV